MDLSTSLVSAALTRVSVLVVEVPGWTATRWAAEREMRRRGWRTATSAADADVLLVCGPPGPRLAVAVATVWSQLPGPRARADVTGPDAVSASLDQAVTALADPQRQRHDAHGRPVDPVTTPTADADDDRTEDSGDDSAEEAGGDTHGGDTGHDDIGHGDTHHGDTHGRDTDMDMDMDMAPGGIPLAGSGGEDRDGLEMDVLSVPLGPVLPCWPAGLVLHCTLAGDVVTAARAEVLGPADDAAAPESLHGTAADRLDRAAQLLVLAGVEDDAATAVRLRDDLAAGADPVAVSPALDRLARRITRSRLLRWSLGGLGAPAPQEHGLDGRLAGTVHDRLAALLADARAALAGGAPHRAPTSIAALPDLVEGLEVGAVRLLVAGLDLDPSAELAPAGGS